MKGHAELTQLLDGNLDYLAEVFMKSVLLLGLVGMSSEHAIYTSENVKL